MNASRHAQVASLKVNFEPLLVTSQINQVVVLNAKSLKPVSILRGHDNLVVQVGVSQLQKSIIALYADNTIAFFCLEKSGSAVTAQMQQAEDNNLAAPISFPVVQDEFIYCGVLQWELTFKTKVEGLNIQSVSLSPLGDFAVLGGNQCVSVWCQDSTLDSFTQQILYTHKQVDDQFGQIVETMPELSGTVTKTLIADSGRLFLTLESTKVLKCWYQSEQARAPASVPKQRRYNINELSMFEFKQRGVTDFNIASQELNPTSDIVQPTLILVFSQNKAYLWAESLTDSEMNFKCCHVFRLASSSASDYPTSQTVSGTFLQLSHPDSAGIDNAQALPSKGGVGVTYEKVLSGHASKIFDTHRDSEMTFKKKISIQNEYGIYPPTRQSNSISLDWLLLMDSEEIKLIKISGVRDIPSQQKISVVKKVPIGPLIRQNWNPTCMLRAWCTKPDDYCTIVASNALHQLFSLVIDFKSPESLRVEGKQSLGQNIKNSKISQVSMHPSLPITAVMLPEKHQIHFFLDNQSTQHPLVFEPHLIFYGICSSVEEIRCVKWMPNMCQLLMLTSSNRVHLISNKQMHAVSSQVGNQHQLEQLFVQSIEQVQEWNSIHSSQLDTALQCQEIVLIDCETKTIQIEDTIDNEVKAVETLLFATISDSGQRVLYKWTFDLTANGVANVVEKQIMKKTAYLDKYTLKHVLATNENIYKSTSAKTDTQRKAEKLAVLVNYKEQVQFKNHRGPPKKPLVNILLAQFHNTGFKDLFKIEGTAEEFLDREVKAKFGQRQMGLVVSQGDYNTESQYLYVYNTDSGRYDGFVDLTKILGIPTKKIPLDFVFLEDKIKTSVAVSSADKVFLIGQTQKNWELKHTYSPLLGLDLSLISSLDLQLMNSSARKTMCLLINNQHLHTFTGAELFIEDKASSVSTLVNQASGSMHSLFVQSQRSLPLFHPSLLSELFIKGYANLVVKLLVKLATALDQLSEVATRVQDYIDFDLQSLIEELRTSAQAMTGTAPTAKAKKKDNAYSVFDDLEESESPDEEEPKQSDAAKIDYNKVFKTNIDDFVKLLATKGILKLGMNRSEVMDLITFVLKFHRIFEMDYYADPLASMLLRRIYCQTEEIEQSKLDDALFWIKKTAPLPGEEDNQVIDVEALKEQPEFSEEKPFSMEEVIKQRLGGDAVVSSGTVDTLGDWDSSMVCQAMYSDNQDVILDQLTDRFNFDQNLTWSLMRRLGVGLWLKNTFKIKQLIELVAKNEYRISDSDKNKSKAEKSALWYCLLNKTAVLSKLYSYEVENKKFSDFFKKDFSNAKNREIAFKNAMRLIPQKKYHLACAFFICAKDIKGACQVAIDRCQDPVLAVLMCRIADPQNENKDITKVLDAWFNKRGQKFNDPYLISIGNWLNKEYVKAVNSLSPAKEDDNVSYLFKNTIQEFDLVSSADTKEQKADQSTVYPLISPSSYLSLDLYKKLQKAPDVKRALNKNWTLDKKPGKGASSIFDDFLGGGDSSSEEEEQKETLQVDENKVMQMAVASHVRQGQTLLALLLIQENQDLASKIAKSNPGLRDKLAKTILLDMVVSKVQTEDTATATSSFQKGLEQLSSFLQLDNLEITDYLLKQLQLLGLLKQEVELIIDSRINQETITNEHDIKDLMRIEAECSKLYGFIQASTAIGAFNLGSHDLDVKANKRLLAMTEYLQQLLDCMIIQSYQFKQMPSEKQTVIETNEIQDSDRPKNTPKAMKIPASGIQLFDLNEGDDYIPSDDEEHFEKQRDQINTLVMQRARGGASVLEEKDFEELQKQTKEHVIAKLGSKFRSALLLVSSLVLLCSQTGKYTLAKDTILELRTILSINQFTNTVNFDTSINFNNLFQFQNLKTHFQKLKNTIKRNIAFCEEIQEINEEAFSNGQRRPEAKRRKPGKSKHFREESDAQTYEFLDMWLKGVIAQQVAAVVSKTINKDTKFFDVKPVGSDVVNNTQKVQKLYLGKYRIFNLQQLDSQMCQMRLGLEQVVSHFFKNQLSLSQKQTVVEELSNIINPRSSKMSDNKIDMGYFFSNFDKFKSFNRSCELNEWVRSLKQMHLSVTRGLTSEAVEFTDRLFQGGIELFKQKNESVVDFCFDPQTNDMLSLAVQGRGLREIGVHHTLIYRNRAANGLETIDEELFSWSDCLHRYEQISAVHSHLKPKSNSINAAVNSMYFNTTAFKTTETNYRRRGNLITEREPKPPIRWGEEDYTNYLKTYSNLDITHEDYSNAVESHPYLPLYVSGNTKGLLCLWSFGQMTDKSLNQWILEPDVQPIHAQAKKATVKKIAFSSYGDKVAAVNMEGSFFLANFDLHESSKQNPLFTTQELARSKECRVSDFDFLDRDSIVATISLKEKQFTVFDTLMPGSYCAMAQVKSTGGNLLQVDRLKSRVYCFNVKPGHLTEHDLRKSAQVVQTRQVSKEEITAVCQQGKYLIIGFADGIIKVVDTDSDFEVVDTIQAFANIYGKKGSVSKIKVHPSNGALFASSHAGCLKLLRLSI